MSGKAPNFLRRGRMPMPRLDSAIEAQFARDWRALKLPQYVRDYRFLRDRRLEIDFAVPDVRFGVEIDGAVHRIKERFHNDREKGALALLSGWTLLRVTGRHVRSGQAIEWAGQLLFRLFETRGMPWPSVHFPGGEARVCRGAPILSSDGAYTGD